MAALRPGLEPSLDHESIGTHDTARDEEHTQANDSSKAHDAAHGEHSHGIDTPQTSDGYLHGLKFALVLIALFLAIFCMALDNTIIATAIPRITDQFHSIGDVGWYGSAYLLTTCAFQLTYGKLYGFISIKWTYFFALTVFEVGSLICGVAPNSTALIVGRAVAGVGAAGLFSGCIIIISRVAPPPNRPMWTALVGGMFGIASVVGPLLGGVFTDRLTWRWCFYINLPLGAVTAVFLVFCFPDPENPTASGLSWKEKLRQFDTFGTLCILGSVICLLLALEWGGSQYRWNSWRIIILLVFFAVLGITFIGIQLWRKDMGTVPPRIFKRRVVWASAWFSFTSAGSFYILVYYIPLWFQAVKKASPERSGIMNLPLILGQVALLVISGRLVTKYGQYAAYMLASTVLATVGSGLMSTFRTSTGPGEWISYQLINGMGRGIGFQMPLVAAQAFLAPRDIPVGAAVMTFFQSFGGAIFVSVGQNVFTTQLLRTLREHVPHFSAEVIMEAGPTEFRSIVPADLLLPIESAYNNAVQASFYVAIAVSAASIIGVVFTEWKSILEKKVEATAEEIEMPTGRGDNQTALTHGA